MNRRYLVIGLVVIIVLGLGCVDNTSQTGIEKEKTSTENSIMQNATVELSYNEKTKNLGIGEIWNLDNGYNVYIRAIDQRAGQVWIEVTKDGIKLDDKVKIVGDTYNYGPINIRIGTISTNKQKEDQTIQKSVDYFLDIKYNLTVNTLDVNGKTNLPEGSIISLDVDRNHHNVGDKDIHVGDLAQTDATVNNGEFFSSLILNDERWFNTVKSLNNVNNEKFEWISNKVNIDIIFTPMNDKQPSEVIKIVGKRGENLEGKYVKSSDIGSLKTLESTFEIDYPINNELISSLGYQIKNYETKIDESKSSDVSDKNNRKVVFYADKYRDGNLAFLLFIYNKGGDCDWIIGDLELDVKSKDGELLKSKKFVSVQKSNFQCSNSESISEIYFGPDISKVYQIDYKFIANGEIYSGILILEGFS